MFSNSITPEDLETLTNTIEGTKTFKLNSEENKMGGMIDDLEALIQNAYLMLSIEANQFIIYPYYYGLNTLDLIGKPYYYVAAVLPGRITETLMSDNRITSVHSFEFEILRNKLHVKFIMNTIYGDANLETVVMY